MSRDIVCTSDSWIPSARSNRFPDMGKKTLYRGMWARVMVGTNLANTENYYAPGGYYVGKSPGPGQCGYIYRNKADRQRSFLNGLKDAPHMATVGDFNGSKSHFAAHFGKAIFHEDEAVTEYKVGAPLSLDRMKIGVRLTTMWV